MRIPNLYTISGIKGYLHNDPPERCNQAGLWVPARPIPYPEGFIQNLKLRAKLAIKVFKGEYDAIDWQQR